MVPSNPEVSQMLTHALVALCRLQGYKEIDRLSRAGLNQELIKIWR
jgi:hypothetical protein